MDGEKVVAKGNDVGWQFEVVSHQSISLHGGV
jgi:hypothetical protein